MNKAVFDPTYPEHPHTLGEKLRKARMDANLEIKELASMIGVTPSTIINWEQGHTNPKSSLVSKIEGKIIQQLIC